MYANAASRLLEAATSRAPASLGPRRTTTTHEFYRYPARFTPELAHAIIVAFTKPGDLVMDPFVGGGTTLVESRLAGRVAIGNDLNQLATFVARVKSTVYPEATLGSVANWVERIPTISMLKSAAPTSDWVDAGYL